ncbi:hypothetical protein EMIHUDRAFT_118323 [Emiliania huxleyi CCMP1516]|uniref:Uncharacterized protein n=2 Tax=Emiliania huxleyi TaxID=2903 RepID=A0A0D3J5A1_EMIH1|nr:hypothetical protein EMIHUDRAFT_118323 [Emiliania huxleyi CCMP1516]EOD18686.1 hypothetical protein EMIHUDRAFT_118323 [Emiliania huxleyi CCMP1516]|eukprot:XP_005771115.1 hypothetical protein EMIHUDRAFT_118323 [Emiliania huxleyi CCMP1516]
MHCLLLALAVVAVSAGPGHSHGDGPWEWGGVYRLLAGDYTWTFSKNAAGIYGAPDESMRVVVLRGGPASDALDDLRPAAEALLQLSQCTLLDGGGEIGAADTCFELRFNQSLPATSWTVRTAIAGNLAIYTEHLPMEFSARLTSTSTGVEVQPEAAVLYNAMHGEAADPETDHDHDHAHEEVADHAHEEVADHAHDHAHEEVADHAHEEVADHAHDHAHEEVADHAHEEVADHDHGEHDHDATSVATAGLVISVLALTVATAGLCLTMSLRQRHAAQPMMSEAATMRRHSASFGAGGDAAQSKGERGMQV